LQPTYAPKSNSGGQSVSERRYIIDEFFNRQYGLHNGSRQLAEALFVSERQMNRILLEYYGKNYREKLNETRGQIGCNLITSSQLSFADIAEILGYTNPANFSTFIKKTYGYSPSQLRRAAQQAEAEQDAL
jgi:AraC-like DNA-binding protein